MSSCNVVVLHGRIFAHQFIEIYQKLSQISFYQSSHAKFRGVAERRKEREGRERERERETERETER